MNCKLLTHWKHFSFKTFPLEEMFHSFAPWKRRMTEEELNKEEQLIKNAVDVFMTYGIKSVKMGAVDNSLCLL